MAGSTGPKPSKSTQPSHPGKDKPTGGAKPAANSAEAKPAAMKPAAPPPTKPKK